MAFSKNFATVENVKAYQEDLNSYLGYTNTKNDFIKAKIWEEEIKRLEELRNFLIAQEERLFQINGIESFENLRKRIQEWDNSGASSLISGSDNFEKLVQTIDNMIQTDDLNEKVAIVAANNSEIQELFTVDAEKNLPLDEIASKLIKQLNEVIGGTMERGHWKGATGHFRELTKGKQFINKENVDGAVGLFRYILIGEPITIKNGEKTEYKYRITFKETIPSRYRNRIYNIIDKITEQETKKIQTDAAKKSQGKIIKLFAEEFPLTGEAKKYILAELRKRFLSYGFSTTKSSIKGALGEIYWTAFWKYITKGRAKVIPVGLEHATGGVIKGQQLPMDVLLKGFGFQVKNYQIDLKTNETIFHKKMFLNGYIKNRLQINTQPFDNFYFSWAYNKVIDTEHARTHYQALFNRFNLIMQQMEENLKRYSTERLDKVLRLDTDFNSNLKIEAKDDLKIVTAYLISNKIIFSSDIVNAIIEQLTNESKDADIGFRSFNINFKEPTTSPTWKPKKRSKAEWPPPNDEDPSNLMKETTIEYEIYLNVDNLLNAAIARLK